MHRAAAVACLAAGLFILAGPGWALLMLGALLWALAPRPQAAREETTDLLSQWRQRGRVFAVRAREAAGRAAQAPRRTTAATSLAVGVVGVPAGTLLMGGAGAAVLTLGGLLVGVGLLTGWNA